MDDEKEAIRARWILQSVSILEDGKGHLGIINYLRTQRLTADEAKAASYVIFDGAMICLKRKQFPIRTGAWILIVVGAGTPMAMYFLNKPVIVFTAAPIILGFVLLAKLQKPTKLPQIKSRS